MARESFVINGVDLMAGQNWDVDSIVVTVPEPVGDDPVVAGRVGSLWRPKVHGQCTIQIGMWLGNPAADRATVWGYWEQIQAAVARPQVLSTAVWTLSEGATRTFQVELIGDPAPARIGSKGYRVQLELNVPSGGWV